jgi:hypothetical protein
MANAFCFALTGKGHRSAKLGSTATFPQQFAHNSSQIAPF